ncbi:TrbI/VirB10 family protein, partial [Sphingomonas parva]
SGAPPPPGGGPGSPFAASLGGRVRSATLANRAGTVPQGTLIPAVMETAFNSNHPGFARAIVSRDVRGFDGSRILIPRGSRLIGEYRSDTTQGQNRALITWQRLVRPDGVTIAIGSPATDRLGRGGVKANVDSHFFERFAGAILRSTVDIGLTLAAVRASNNNNGVLLALPGTLQGGGLGAAAGGQNIRPTLKVPPGRSISVFVSRDLDFGGGRE